VEVMSIFSPKAVRWAAGAAQSVFDPAGAAEVGNRGITGEGSGFEERSRVLQSGPAHLRISAFTVKKMSLLPTLTPSRGLKN